MRKNPPVLLLAFNRPHHLHALIQRLRLVKPAIVYCAQDGPRTSKPGEKKKCSQVTKVFQEIDWPCEKHFLIRKKNLGCQKGVSEAISWFFQHEEAGIILEDDCLPDPSFFQYCSELLKKYKNNAHIMHISGNSFSPPSTHSPQFQNTSYRFSRYTHCWGWATWRRAWKLFDKTMTDWPGLKSQHWLNQQFNSPFSRWYWARTFDAVYEKRVDSWAIPWLYTCWFHQGLSILPNENLVTNVGFGKDSTHTSDPQSPMANMQVKSMKFPLIHPTTLEKDQKSDDYDQRHVYEQLTPKQLISFAVRKLGFQH